jgi:hypothetical protein
MQAARFGRPLLRIDTDDSTHSRTDTISPDYDIVAYNVAVLEGYGSSFKFNTGTLSIWLARSMQIEVVSLLTL